MTVDWHTEDSLTRWHIRGSIWRSPMVSLKDDHPAWDCNEHCMLDAARWPEPRPGNDLAQGWPA